MQASNLTRRFPLSERGSQKQPSWAMAPLVLPCACGECIGCLRDREVQCVRASVQQPLQPVLLLLLVHSRSKELSVRADNKIQPRRKIHKQSFPPIRVLSTGRSEPHLIYKLSFWLSIIKTIVAMAIQRVLQLHERQMARLFVGGDVACLPGLSSFVAG